jgi:hypothetical protein
MGSRFQISLACSKWLIEPEINLLLFKSWLLHMAFYLFGSNFIWLKVATKIKRPYHLVGSHRLDFYFNQATSM